MATELQLTPEQLGLLRECGALLAPAEPGVPGFEAADPDGELLELAVQQFGPRLAGIVARLESADGQGAAQKLAALAHEHPAAFKDLRDLLICCYLSTPRMWDLLGYNGRTPRPAHPGEAEEWLSDGILDPVLARGPIYLSPLDGATQA